MAYRDPAIANWPHRDRPMAMEARSEPLSAGLCTCEPVIDNLSADLDGLPFGSVPKAIHNNFKAIINAKLATNHTYSGVPIVNRK